MANEKGDKYEIASKVPADAHPLADKAIDIASNINYRAHFSPHFAPLKFEPEQAFYATAESLRDRLPNLKQHLTQSMLSFGC